MIKKFYLMPIFALSLAGFALAGCDDKAEKQADTGEVITESLVPTEGTAMTETAALEQMEENREAAVHVSNARAFATAESAANGAIFVSLHNTGSATDTLLGAKAADVAESVELHQTYMDPQTNTMLMRPTSAIDIAAGQTLTMEPSSYHIMLIGLKQPLVKDNTFNVTLNFRNAGEVIVPVMITAPGATDAGSIDHSGHDHSATAPEESYVPPSEEDAVGSDGSAAVDPAAPAGETVTETEETIVVQ